MNQSHQGNYFPSKSHWMVKILLLKNSTCYLRRRTTTLRCERTQSYAFKLSSKRRHTHTKLQNAPAAPIHTSQRVNAESRQWHWRQTDLWWRHLHFMHFSGSKELEGEDFDETGGEDKGVICFWWRSQIYREGSTGSTAQSRWTLHQTGYSVMPERKEKSDVPL